MDGHRSHRQPYMNALRDLQAGNLEDQIRDSRLEELREDQRRPDRHDGCLRRGPAWTALDGVDAAGSGFAGSLSCRNAWQTKGQRFEPFPAGA